MKNSIRLLGIPVVALLILLLAGCESTDRKKAAAVPPPQAMAPTVSAPAPAGQKLPDLREQQAAAPADPAATIAAAEKAYQDGLADYKAGHLDTARRNFDHAVDILLSGPVAMKDDERLEREFDKIVEGTRNLEMQALKEGDGFSEQPAEQAPIEEANQVTFPVDPRLKAQAEEELKQTHSDLPLMITDQVASYISYFSSPRGKAVLEHGLVRAGMYRDMVSRILKEEGVPQDLIYLAQAESGFHPTAVSRAGARGMWQFMASRASEYGLERNWWVDDREDPEKSTRAAAHHLKDLFNMFGDWYLAMAAYNSGPLTVQNAVKRTGYADFWQLYNRNVLPAETKNYVPIILAVTIMAKNPKQYGLEDLVPDPPLEYDTVKVDYPVDLRLVAECVDSTAETLQRLNPSLLRMITPKNEEFTLKLPPGTREKYLTNIAAIPEDKRVAWRFHKVTEGETVAEIARRYHASVSSISEANGLEDDRVEAGNRLVIPVTRSREEGEQMRYSRKATRYRVRRGDTVLSVADDFGVAPEMLRKWNRLRGNRLIVGRLISIHRPLLTAAPERSRKKASKSRRIKEIRSKFKAAPKPRKAVKETRKRAPSKPAARSAKKSPPRRSGEVSEKR
jgi:membrane-bound lytic murein transglycosylase D